MLPKLSSRTFVCVRVCVDVPWCCRPGHSQAQRAGLPGGSVRPRPHRAHPPAARHRQPRQGHSMYVTHQGHSIYVTCYCHSMYVTRHSKYVTCHGQSIYATRHCDSMYVTRHGQSKYVTCQGHSINVTCQDHLMYALCQGHSIFLTRQYLLVYMPMSLSKRSDLLYVTFRVHSMCNTYQGHSLYVTVVRNPSRSLNVRYSSMSLTVCNSLR